MTFGVPLGPGIEDVTVQRTALTDEGASFAVDVAGHGTHFTTSAPRVFLKRGDHIVHATAVTAQDDGHLTCQIDLPLQVPARSFDVFVNGAKDGTISFANGFFAEGLEVQEGASLSLTGKRWAIWRAPIWAFTFPFSPTSWKASATSCCTCPCGSPCSC